MQFDNLLGKYPDTKIAEIFRLASSKIWKRRTELNIASYHSKNGKTVPYNIHVFDVINDEAAYWLGFYYADGCLCHTTNNRKVITISSLDGDHIAKLAHWYGVDNSKIRINILDNGNTNYGLHLCNRYLFDRLNDLGCIPNKSRNAYPPLIENNMINPFILGLYDGDGSLSVNSTINSWKVSIGSGSIYMCNWISHWMSEHNIVHCIEERKLRNTFYNIATCGVYAKGMLDILYKSINNTDIPLRRKFNKYEILSKCKLANPQYNKWELDIMATNPPEVATKLINIDPRNIGWIRTISGISKKCKNA